MPSTFRLPSRMGMIGAMGGAFMLATASSQQNFVGASTFFKPSLCFAVCEDASRSFLYGGACSTSTDCINRCDCDACCVDMNTGCHTPEAPHQSNREACPHRTEGGKEGCAWCEATNRCSAVSACSRSPSPLPPTPPVPMCSPAEGCNVCAKCCKSYLEDASDCSKCAKAECESAGPGLAGGVR